MVNDYFQHVHELLQRIAASEAATLTAAAEAAAATIAAGGVLHLFGCGHSHMLAEEAFYRAGGLACIHPICDEGLMLHGGALKSSDLERFAGYGRLLLQREDIRPGEVLFVFSTSGRNPVPVEAAEVGRERGAVVVAVTSRAYSASQPSRHSSGRRLFELADIVIDNHVPPGDAILTAPGVPAPFAPVSTVLGAAILNALLAQTVALLVARGVEPPVFRSGNLDGADAHNQRLAERYRGRVAALR